MRRNDLGLRPTSREELAVWYASALEDLAASGLSVAAYAAQIGVTPATLYQWRRRLSSSGDAVVGGDRGRLVEVTIGGRSSTCRDVGMVVHVGGGRRCIEVPRGFDSEDLRRLVVVLESC